MCCVSENFPWRKTSWIGGGSKKFSRGSFSPHSAESFRRRKPFLFHYCRASRKFGSQGGGIKIFRRNFFPHSAEKIRRGYPIVFQ